MIKSDSVQKFEVEVNVADNGVIELVGRVELAEANEDACAAIIVHFAADVQVNVLNRNELLVKMHDTLAKAARNGIDEVVEGIEQDIDEVRAGAPLADYTFYFEL